MSTKNDPIVTSFSERELSEQIQLLHDESVFGLDVKEDWDDLCDRLKSQNDPYTLTKALMAKKLSDGETNEAFLLAEHIFELVETDEQKAESFSNLAHFYLKKDDHKALSLATKSLEIMETPQGFSNALQAAHALNQHKLVRQLAKNAVLNEHSYEQISEFLLGSHPVITKILKETFQQ